MVEESESEEDSSDDVKEESDSETSSAVTEDFQIDLRTFWGKIKISIAIACFFAKYFIAFYNGETHTFRNCPQVRCFLCNILLLQITL